MQKHFTDIRILLIFVGINLVMFLMLVTSMTSAHPWLARVLPGHFEAGVNSSGYWVFFALVLLVDAVTVLIAGLALLLPAMMDSSAIEERRLARHLVDRGGVSEEAKESIFVAMREEVVAAHYQIVVGRTILLAGAVFLVFAFFAVSLSFARALPDGTLYANASGPVQNVTVRAWDIERFTDDQIAGAVLLNAPDIYGWHFGTLTNNSANGFYTNFVFTFRAVTGFVLLLIVLSLLRRGQRPSREKKTIESVEAAAEEKKA
jgi:hypothetical protein